MRCGSNSRGGTNRRTTTRWSSSFGRARSSTAGGGACGCLPTRRAPPSPSLTNGPLFAALDDFTLSTPSLEDVYLTLGGAARDLERA